MPMFSKLVILRGNVNLSVDVLAHDAHLFNQVLVSTNHIFCFLGIDFEIIVCQIEDGF